MPTMVPGTGTTWIQAITIPNGYGLGLSATGLVEWLPGTSNAGGSDAVSGTAANFPADPVLVNRYGCAGLLLPIGVSPNNGIQYTSNVLGFPRTDPEDDTAPVTVSFTHSDLPALCDIHNSGPWVLWLRYNDDVPAGNTGEISVTATAVAPESTIMGRYLFSTGKYLASLPLPAPTVNRRTKGSTSAATQPLGNLIDVSVSTYVDLVCVDDSNKQYLALDFGAAVDLGRISLYNVSLTGGTAALTCYAHSASITNGDFSSATAIPVTHTPTGGDNDWEFAPNSGTLTKRYLYIVPSGGATACTIGDVDVRSTEYTLAAMQNVEVTIAYQTKEVREAASITLYPIDCALYNGSIAVNPEFTDLNEQGIVLFTGAQLDTMADHILTPGATTDPLAFVGELIGQDSAGRKIRLITYHTRAPGFTWSTKVDDFAGSKLTTICRMPDADAANASRVWRMILGQ